MTDLDALINPDNDAETRWAAGAAAAADLVFAKWVADKGRMLELTYGGAV